MSRILTGVKPTADLHLGNYAGSIRPCIEFSKDKQHEVLLMCADWHALTDRDRILEQKHYRYKTLAAFLTLGFDLNGNSLFFQSDFTEIQEIAWYLSCVAGIGLLERAHAYKDALQSGKKPTGGLFYYPVLMAADIVTFDADEVPVGKDQAQHLEYMTDLVGLFNNATQKEALKAAKPLIQETPLLIGTDGAQKMSKSYDNFIPMFAPAKEIEKRIKTIKTDSKGVDEPKDPDTCAIFSILKAFAPKDAIAHMEDKLRRGKGYGYGHAKLDLIQAHEAFFGVKREEYQYYCDHPKEVLKKMEPGYERLRLYAKATRDRVRETLGLV